MLFHCICDYKCSLGDHSNFLSKTLKNPSNFKCLYILYEPLIASFVKQAIWLIKFNVHVISIVRCSAAEFCVDSEGSSTHLSWGSRLGALHRCCGPVAQQEPQWPGLSALGLVCSEERQSDWQSKLTETELWKVNILIRSKRCT